MRDWKRDTPSQQRSFNSDNECPVQLTDAVCAPHCNFTRMAQAFEAAPSEMEQQKMTLGCALFTDNIKISELNVARWIRSGSMSARCLQVHPVPSATSKVGLYRFRYNIPFSYTGILPVYAGNWQNLRCIRRFRIPQKRYILKILNSDAG
jgi:hypothetical protein